jgi:catechol 2,3-dioxygenase-like lactoylglutathione lyase family enzyme
MATETRIGRLTTTLVECADLEKTGAYYRETLGLDVKNQGDNWIVFDSGGHDLVLWQGTKSEVVLGFTGAHLESARSLLLGRGAEPGPTDQHPGGEHFYLRDPEGNTIAIND